ncbi:hypothetical protein NC99_29530 [Sunxiuqinia dokdonensis]|uniref:Uncharacterized protein n=1 Tax=Sunxiuqinia dokdonensis TaxID=1409788 RepID=A0A0L8V7S4_9BACT|nr:hypothetical protein NC99_29530 [Sunxiuqinia dokdonensis]
MPPGRLQKKEKPFILIDRLLLGYCNRISAYVGSIEFAVVEFQLFSRK